MQRYLLSTVMPGITRALADIVLAKGSMTREEAIRVSCYPGAVCWKHQALYWPSIMYVFVAHGHTLMLQGSHDLQAVPVHAV